jgi:hypothetical protein
VRAPGQGPRGPAVRAPAGVPRGVAVRAPAGVLRGVADARTARSLPVRVGPGGEREVYAQLAQLARERQRLAGEHDLWQRKLTRITRRLTEIDSQIQRLNHPTPHTGPPPTTPPHHQTEFPY